LLQAAASVLQICLIFALPESPRWLVEQGYEDRAAAVLIKYHANGDENDPIVALEMAEIAQAIHLDRQINATTSYKTLISNHANRYRTMIIIAIGFFSQWSGNGLISYYLSLILNSIGYSDSQDQLMINGVLQAYNLVLGIAFAFIVNKFRRRTLWLFSTSGISVTFIAWTVCEALYERSNDSGSPNLAAGRAVLGLIFIYNFFFNSGWLTLQVVCKCNTAQLQLTFPDCIEILPLSIRARGLAIYNLSVSLAGFVNQYVNPIGLQKLGWKCEYLGRSAATSELR
jgi:hypothetical protein